MLTEEEITKLAAQVQSRMAPAAAAKVEPTAEKKPRVRLPGDGRLMSAFAEAVAEILAKNGVYLRDSVPVVVDPSTKRSVTLDPDCLRTFAERSMVTFAMKKSGDQHIEVPKTMTRDAASAVMHSHELLSRLSVLRSVSDVPLPVLRADGSVALMSGGYDAESQVLVNGSMVYDEMTVEEARAVLDDVLADFPFADDGRSKAVQIAAMLSPFAINLLSRGAQTPMFVYTANSQRSGKTLAAKTAIIPTMGSAAAQTLSGDDEELRKVLDSVVRDGSPYLLLDNLKRKITSPALEAFVTSASWSGRVLGSSRTFLMEKQTILFLTANNAQVSTDIAGRALFVDLWIAEADPQSRRIRRFMDDAYLARADVRQRILSALMGLVRHWDRSGRPAPESKLAGFEEWGRIIGGITVASGYGDPLTRPVMTVAGDPDAVDMQELVRLLSEMQQPEDGFDFPEIMMLCLDKNLFEGAIDGKRLRPKEGDETFEQTAKSKSRMGRLLTSYDGRVFRYDDGTAIRFGKRGKNRSRRYRIEKVTA